MKLETGETINSPKSGESRANFSSNVSSLRPSVYKYTASQWTDYIVGGVNDTLEVNGLNTCHGCFVINQTKGIIAAIHIFVQDNIETFIHMKKKETELFTPEDIINTSDNCRVIVFDNGSNRKSNSTKELFEKKGIPVSMYINSAIGGVRRNPIGGHFEVLLRGSGDEQIDGFGLSKMEIQQMKQAEMQSYKTKFGEQQEHFVQLITKLLEKGVEIKDGDNLFSKLCHTKQSLFEEREKEKIVQYLRLGENLIDINQFVYDREMLESPFLGHNIPSNINRFPSNDHEALVTNIFFSYLNSKADTLIYKKGNNYVICGPLMKQDIIIEPGETIIIDMQDSHKAYVQWYDKYYFDGIYGKNIKDGNEYMNFVDISKISGIFNTAKGPDSYMKTMFFNDAKTGSLISDGVRIEKCQMFL